MNINEQIIRMPEVESTVGLSAATIYRRIKAGEFPAQVKLGKHASGWLKSEVQGWIQQQKQKKEGHSPANDEQHQQAA